MIYLLAEPHASNFVESVDRTFVFIFSVVFFFLIAVTLTMIWFIYRYNKKRNPVATQIKGNTALEIVWTVIPTIIVLVMFYYGVEGWRPMKNPPKDSFEIEVIARMWNFTFKYKNGKTSDTLLVPVDKPVKLNLTSVDVIHAVYIPAFRVKEDVVPGRDKFLWFIPQKEGKFDLFCAEYCGLQHSAMYTSVKVLPGEEFNKWYADTTARAIATTASPGAAGRQIMTSIGCFACHTTDGSKLVGPSFKGIFGHEVTVTTNGQKRTITVDEEYVKRSIFNPEADVVEGFNKGLMQTYKDQLSDEDIAAITEYLKTLK